MPTEHAAQAVHDPLRSGDIKIVPHAVEVEPAGQLHAIELVLQRSCAFAVNRDEHAVSCRETAFLRGRHVDGQHRPAVGVCDVSVRVCQHVVGRDVAFIRRPAVLDALEHDAVLGQQPCGYAVRKLGELASLSGVVIVHRIY